MSFWEAYPWSPVLIVGLIALGFGFCFFICRCTYSIYMKFEKSNNIPAPEPAVNQIYTMHDDEMPSTGPQTMASHCQTIEHDASTFNQETYPPWQCEDNTRDVLPPAYDSVMSSDKLTLVK